MSNNQKPFNPKNPTKRLTKKQAIFVKHIIDNPKASATQAARVAYNATTSHSAEVIAFENMRKPEIVSALAEHNNLVESALINTVNDWKDSSIPREREISMDVAKFVHDKIHGKAKQVQEVSTTGVTLHFDITSSLQDGG